MNALLPGAWKFWSCSFPALFLVGCAIKPLPSHVAFDAPPRYPITVVQISPQLTLRHQARARCEHDCQECPRVGSEGTRTRSNYRLDDRRGALSLTVPSMLSDARIDFPDFRTWRKTGDRLSIHVSESGNTILIIEDSSPVLPNYAYLLLRRAAEGRWTWREIEVPTFRDASELPTPLYLLYPDVTGLSDNEISFEGPHKTWSGELVFKKTGKAWVQKLDTLPTRHFTD